MKKVSFHPFLPIRHSNSENMRRKFPGDLYLNVISSCEKKKLMYAVSKSLIIIWISSVSCLKKSHFWIIFAYFHEIWIFDYFPWVRSGVVGDLNFMFSHYREVKFVKYMGQLPFASIYLLKAQIATTIYLFPFFVTGSFPVKSTCTRHIIFGVTGIGISGGTGAALNTLFLWPQIIHSFVFIRTYFSPLYQ